MRALAGSLTKLYSLRLSLKSAATDDEDDNDCTGNTLH